MNTAIEIPAGARRFSGPQLLQIAMPMGGIGAGSVSLTGFGSLVDWAIRNHPATSALPDNWKLHESAFGLLHIKGQTPITKLLEGPLPVEMIYDQGLQAQGFRRGFYEGLPRFETATFSASYPTGRVELSHPQIPLAVSITGFNPFIPLDDRNSGLPCAILEYEFVNRSQKPVEFEFSYHCLHPAIGLRGNAGTRNAAIPGFGVQLSNDDKPNVESCGTAAIGLIGHEPKIKAMWLRGAWWDFIASLWREVSTGTFKENDGKTSKELDGTNGGSILVPHTLKPGERIIFPIILAWHFPNVHYRLGGIGGKQYFNDDPPQYGGDTDNPPAWRPWYATQWKDARDVALYVKERYSSLRGRTVAFRDALYASTLPSEVIDAVASNLAILKSPTVLRSESGNLWGWEGCFTTHGSCHGSCNHVWNYAQALPHLFPQLERTLREGEYERSMDETGHVTFRSAIPDGPTPHDFHAAADGQLGGIMKLFRDWRICGDRAWLQRLYPLAKRSLEYCIRAWDPHRRGAVEEPHHNTYDIEFWGPDGMTTSCYAGALAAMAQMARDLAKSDDAKTYDDLAKRAGEFLDRELFNGEYHQQRVQWKDLKDQSFAKKLDELAADGSNAELLALLREEGPRYQYGSGCLSDGVIGLWMAELYGVDVPVEREKVRSSLKSIFRFNFKKDLSDHANTQRPGYALGHEPGLILCTWPKEGKPTIPFVYCDEVWTGIEYQVASHLILNGMVDEGLTLVRAVRGRYEGHVRNPFNEYECGSFYARAMASYAVLTSLSGFRYSAATQELWFQPKITERPFRCFFSTATGFGVISLEENHLAIQMIEGKLTVRTVHCGIDLDCNAEIAAGETKKVTLG